MTVRLMLTLSLVATFVLLSTATANDRMPVRPVKPAGGFRNQDELQSYLRHLSEFYKLASTPRY